jgi:fluoride ion exporter CrcB/FEX
LIEDGQLGEAAGNVMGSVVIGLAAAAVGVAMGLAI